MLGVISTVAGIYLKDSASDNIGGETHFTTPVLSRKTFPPSWNRTFFLNLARGERARTTTSSKGSSHGSGARRRF